MRRNASDIKVYLSRERYRAGWRWRVTILQEGTRSSQTFNDEGEAREVHAAALRESRERRELTVSDLIGMWTEDLGRRCTSETVRHAKGLTTALHQEGDQYACDVTPEMALTWYREYQEGRAVATHRAALQHTKAMWKWAVEEELIRRSPFLRVRPEGVRRRGKTQLRLDEARRFVVVAMAEVLSANHDRYTNARRRGAMGALLALYCGLRSGEIRGLRGRDIDDAGRLVWVERGKTEHAARVAVVPAILRAPLVEFAEKAGPKGLLFPCSDNWLSYTVNRLCTVANVQRVTPHGLRGTHASVARREGATSELVASALGHGGQSGTKVVDRHYIDPAMAAAADEERLAEVLAFPTRPQLEGDGR